MAIRRTAIWPFLPLAILACLLFSAAASHAKTNIVIEGKCVGVHDGDTVTVLDSTNIQHKIRLAGIDAPELGQAFGQRAKQALSSLVFGKEVRVSVVDTDRYGRTVGDVHIGTNWVNLAVVSQGWAWHYKAYSKDKGLAEAEQSARERRLGLWVDKEPTPPWEFRSEKNDARQVGLPLGKPD